VPPSADLKRIADRYATFARDEARGASPSYEQLAMAVAETPDLLQFLATLPADRQQPNLFLAAVRRLHGVPADPEHLTTIVRDDAIRIRALMMVRTTQTNEPARCAVLMPVLAQLPQPLALIEVGASAGLCLLPDRYRYQYRIGSSPAVVSGGTAPIFRCQVSGPVPMPSAVPRIVWRRGLDLNPLDPTLEDDVAWLETLVWPEQEDRLRGLRAAIGIARPDPPVVVRGNLLTDLAALIEAAPAEATVVVFHTAVLAYVEPSDRARFAETVTASRATWISNEATGVFPGLAAAAPAPPSPGLFLLMQDGVPLAWTGPHGQSIDWFGATPAAPSRRAN
jgi:hypothetical protein